MAGRKDITGVRYGRYVAVRFVGLYRGKSAIWECVCDCGTVKNVHLCNLTTGSIKGCGCQRRESRSRPKFRHGMCDTSTYIVWKSMLDRCRRPKNSRWERYGGRGITVCSRWFKFENFLADMGERPPGLSIDRINNDGNYEPGNCRWATNKVQRNNKSPINPTTRHDPNQSIG